MSVVCGFVSLVTSREFFEPQLSLRVITNIVIAWRYNKFDRQFEWWIGMVWVEVRI